MTLFNSFIRFHDDNPGVYELFQRFAFEAYGRGHRRMSADLILPRVRWETDVVTRDNSFKLNNNWTAYYARLFMWEFPRMEGFFNIRAARSADEMQVWLERNFEDAA